MFWVISRSVAGWMSRSFLLRHMEQAQDRHGILGKSIRRRHGQTLAVEAEAFEFARPQGLPKGGQLGLAATAVFQRGHEDARQVADRLGVEIIVLGEALDATAARAILVAQPARDLAR